MIALAAGNLQVGCACEPPVQDRFELLAIDHVGLLPAVEPHEQASHEHRESNQADHHADGQHDHRDAQAEAQHHQDESEADQQGVLEEPNDAVNDGHA
jgi:hypothetical protein